MHALPLATPTHALVSLATVDDPANPTFVQVQSDRSLLLHWNIILAVCEINCAPGYCFSNPASQPPFACYCPDGTIQLRSCRPWTNVIAFFLFPEFAREEIKNRLIIIWSDVCVSKGENQICERTLFHWTLAAVTLRRYRITRASTVVRQIYVDIFPRVCSSLSSWIKQEARQGRSSVPSVIHGERERGTNAFSFSSFLPCSSQCQILFCSRIEQCTSSRHKQYSGGSLEKRFSSLSRSFSFSSVWWLTLNRRLTKQHRRRNDPLILIFIDLHSNFKTGRLWYKKEEREREKENERQRSTQRREEN